MGQSSLVSKHAAFMMRMKLKVKSAQHDLFNYRMQHTLGTTAEVDVLLWSVWYA